MTTSDPSFVWIWLPGATEPVVCGRLDQVGEELWFAYARSYLERDDRIALEPLALPLRRGQQRPEPPLEAHGVIRDAAPDAWGMRVILRRLVGIDGGDSTELRLLTYLREAGSNRIGALDIQDSPETFTARTNSAPVKELLAAAERIERGEPFSAALDEALTHGTSVGGARPKALLTADDGTELIAKFSVSTDTFPWMQAEAIGMEVSRRCGVNTAPTVLQRIAGRDVLLVTRFDRLAGGARRHMLSALTLFGLHELAARHGSYVDLADMVKMRFTEPEQTLQQLFTRIAVNILVGNTDDHPRNHAAFWDGEMLALTPAYDVCPQPRSGGETAQAMSFGPEGARSSRLSTLAGSADVFHLTKSEATAVIERCTAVVRDQFDEICLVVGATDATRELLWQRAVAIPSVFYA